LILICRGTPAAVDDELHPVDGRTSCSPANGSEEISVKVAYGRNLVVKNSRAVGDGTVSLLGAVAIVALVSYLALNQRDVVAEPAPQPVE